MKEREVNIIWEPTQKQKEAFTYLEDNTTTEVFYGGAAGSGKSYFGCAWIILNCLRYPGTRWLIGRAVLKSLKESTLLTFFAVCKDWGLVMGEDFKYNSVEGLITFLRTGSTVYLKDLFSYPSDPEFDSLGSTEFTGYFLDEVAQIKKKAHDIVKSRVRYKLDEFGLIPKGLLASNPCKNFAYYDFYKLWKNKTLPKYRKFIPAFVDDNPFMTKFYKENLEKLERQERERLLHGNWEFDEDDAKLFEYDDILDMFSKSYNLPSKHKYFISCDVARMGKDKTVIMVWAGLFIKKIFVFSKQDTKETRKRLTEVMKFYAVDKDRVIVDEDGIGGGIVDEIGCKGFINNSRALELKSDNNPGRAFTEPPKHNYANLKSQCYYLLSKYVKEGKIGMYKAVNEQVKELIIEDLEQVKQKDADKDGKLAVEGKDKVKERLGRSPDFSDAIMFRMFFELKPIYKPYIAFR